MSRRRLRDDELDLWKSVAKSANPMHPKSTQSTSLIEPKTGAKKPSADRSVEPIPTFSVGAKATLSSQSFSVPAISDQVNSAPVAMDFKTYKSMRRGKLKPEARIDLHGMRVDQAHRALTEFILRAHTRGQRLVLVITGKGRRSDDDGPIPTRIGVLRHEVPQWLQQSPLAPSVLQVTTASDRHGGQGAYYVYLRRN